MKLIKAITPLLLVFFMIGCADSDSDDNNKGNSTANEYEEALPQVEEVFPELYRSIASADSSFATENFDGGQTDTKTDSADEHISNQTIVKFMPYLIFNADSTYAIDLIMNNYVPVEKGDSIVLAEGGPDFEVGLINLRENTRKQLLFFGTMGVVMDASWADKNTVMIAGANEVQNDSIKPVIWKYEIPSRAWSVFTYDKMIPFNAADYPRKWMKTLAD